MSVLTHAQFSTRWPQIKRWSQITCGAHDVTTPTNPTRRNHLASTMALTLLLAPPATHALPLAPLGNVSDSIGGPKRAHLAPQQIADILAHDLRDSQYFITGKLTYEIFADDCRFRDPTNDVVGLARYVKALGILFDPEYSEVTLRDIQVTSPHTIEAAWTLGGVLKLPWRPSIKPIVGRCVYYLNDQGLIELQDQTWNISAAEALRETFTLF